MGSLVPMTEEPKRVFLGYKVIGSRRYEKWRYVDVPLPKDIRTPDLIRGAFWEVRREGERYFLEFIAARHGGGLDLHEITRDEFDAMQDGRIGHEDLLRAYNGRKPLPPRPAKP